MVNKEYEHGYRMGYEWASVENGKVVNVFKELRSRGISMRTTYAVAFRSAVKDYADGRQPRYV